MPTPTLVQLFQQIASTIKYKISVYTEEPLYEPDISINGVNFPYAIEDILNNGIILNDTYPFPLVRIDGGYKSLNC